jgi:AcrR family transcriptional regulator
MPRKNQNEQREEILESARKLFWESGYDKTTMKDIARTCGFEPPNLYNYFKSKEQVLYEVMLTEMQRILNPLKRLKKVEMSPPEKLQAFVKANLDVNLSRPGRAGLFETELKNLTPGHRKTIIRMRDTYDSILIGIIRDGINSGHFVKVDEKITGYLISSIITRTRIWYSSDGRLSPDQIEEIIINFILKGMGKKADVNA